MFKSLRKLRNPIVKLTVNDIFSVLHPIQILHQLLGIMPVTIGKARSAETPEMSVRESKFGFIIALILLTLTLTHSIQAPNVLIELEKSIVSTIISQDQRMPRNVSTESAKQSLNNHRQTTLVKMMHPLMICITSTAARVSSVSILMRMVPVLLRKIHKIDQLLTLPGRFYSSNLVALLFMVVITILLNVPLMWFHLWQLSTFHATLRATVWEAFNMLNVFTSFCLEMQFVSFCYLVKSRFKWINDQLLTSVAREFDDDWNLPCPNWKLKKWIDVVYRRCIVKKKPGKIQSFSEVLDLFRRLDAKNARYLNAMNFSTTTMFHNRIRKPKNDTSQWIKSLRSSHILLFDVMEDLNAMYQIYLLVSIFSSVSKILFNLYFSIFGFISDENIPPEIIEGSLYLISFWSVYFSVRFIKLVVASHLTCKESKKARKIIFKIDRNQFDLAGKKELKEFIDHLFGRDFEFSACGLFKLNMSLITSSFSYGITYLVIMAQFH